MPLKMESGLHVGKVVEITAASTKSFEDAIALGIDRASKTLKNVQGAWVKEQKVKVKNAGAELKKAFDGARAKFK